MDCSPSRLLCPWDFPGKNTEVGCHFLLQRIFLTQVSNSDLLHCRQILYHLSHQESKLTVVHTTTTMHYCCCLASSMDRGTWHGFTRRWPRLSTSASARVLLLTSVVISHANANSPNPHQNQSSWWDHHPPFTNPAVSTMNMKECSTGSGTQAQEPDCLVLTHSLATGQVWALNRVLTLSD